MSTPRRGSIIPGMKKFNADLSKRRGSVLAQTSTKADIQPLKENDVYYKTQKIYTSLDLEEDVTWTTVKPYDPNSPLPAPIRNKSADRRASTYPTIREDSQVFDERLTSKDTRYTQLIFGCSLNLAVVA